MHTDPIADMVTRIRNACRARKERVSIPLSNVKVEIAKVLKEEGFIVDFRTIAERGTVQKVLEIKLKYDNSGPVIDGVQRLSKPGLRRYMRRQDIPKVRDGLGITILSTSKGVMSDRAAREQHLGGEALCSVW